MRIYVLKGLLNNQIFLQVCFFSLQHLMRAHYVPETLPTVL